MSVPITPYTPNAMTAHWDVTFNMGAGFDMDSFNRFKGWLTFVAIVAGLALALGPRLHAQGLGWEGETGIFVTPLAYTASAEGQKIHPVVAYHYLNAGPVIGDFHEASIEVGVGKRLEFGYTHEFHVFGGNPDISPLWQNGFDIFNGKVNVVRENYGSHKWVPAISTGFVFRPNVRNVGNWVEGSAVDPAHVSGKADGDIYVVATKFIPLKPIPVILSGGVRGTDAVLWGMGGNAPDWEARAFGSAAFVFKAPRHSTLILASEVAQQPHHPLDFPTLNIPTTLTYAVRFIPPAKYKVNFDVGLAQIAGKVMPGVDLQARHQVGVQMSYAF